LQNNVNAQHPKVTTVQSNPSRVSSSLQDAIQHLDQAPETALMR
jgi:hypothetical protein